MRWYLGAGILLLVALVFQLGLLAYAMYVLLGVLLVSRWLARRWIQSLSATRQCNRQTAHVGEKAEVAVTIRNQSWLPVPWVLMEDLLPRQALVQRPPRLRVAKGKRLKISLLTSRGQTKLKYQVELQMRGYYQVGPLILESGDVFGLHRRYRVVTEPHFVLVYPRVIPLEGYDLASRRPIGEVRLTHRLYEDPTRIAGVRYYERGDPFNRIHWRATARTATLHSKVYEPSTIAGATILLDFHSSGYHLRGEPYRSELAVTAAASLANTVYHLGQQVGLVTNGRDAADRIRLEGWEHQWAATEAARQMVLLSREAARQSGGMLERSERLRPLIVETRRGTDQFMRILETLARVELTDGLTLPQLLGEVSGRIPRDATVVAILSQVTDETALALGNLRRQGFAVTALLVLFEDNRRLHAYGRLLAEGVEVRHIQDEASLSALCRQHLVR